MKTTPLGLLIPEDAVDPPDGAAQIGGNAEAADALLQAGGVAGSIYAAGEVTRTNAALGSMSTPLKVPLKRIRAKQPIEVLAFAWAKASVESRGTEAKVTGGWFGLTLNGVQITPELHLADGTAFDVAANSFRQIATTPYRFAVLQPGAGTTNSETDYKVGEFQATIERAGLGSVSPFVRPFIFVPSAELTNVNVELVARCTTGTVTLVNAVVLARAVG